MIFIFLVMPNMHSDEQNCLKKRQNHRLSTRTEVNQMISMLKSHLTWIFYSHFSLSLSLPRVCMYTYADCTNDKRLPFTMFGWWHSFLCHLFAAISLPNPLITHDKTQQRDKIAVKINDLKQKHSKPNKISECM